MNISLRGTYVFMQKEVLRRMTNLLVTTWVLLIDKIRSDLLKKFTFNSVSFRVDSGKG